MQKKLGFIGGGRVTRILLEGWKKKGVTLGEVVVSDINEDVLADLKKRFPAIKTVLNGNGEAAAQEIVFLAVHPPVVGDVLPGIKETLRQDVVFVSLVPKVKIALLQEKLGGVPNLARLIPNACSVINEGYNPLACSSAMDGAVKQELLDLFGSLGRCPEVDENHLEAYAIISAMGPTYFWFQWEALRALGRSFGLQQEAVDQALANMLSGSLNTLLASGMDFAEVNDLIPVKPLQEDEAGIKQAYSERLEGLYKKLTS